MGLIFIVCRESDKEQKIKVVDKIIYYILNGNTGVWVNDSIGKEKNRVRYGIGHRACMTQFILCKGGRADAKHEALKKKNIHINAS